jgi:hypothetical protein
MSQPYLYKISVNGARLLIALCCPFLSAFEPCQISYPNAGVSAYVDATCFHPNADHFENLLDDDVVLSHITDDIAIYDATGKQDVTALYRKYLFDITTNFVVKNLKINSSVEENVASIDLAVEEDKEGYAGIQEKGRWHFDDHTTLTFVKNEDGFLKIAKIVTRVSKYRVTSSTVDFCPSTSVHAYIDACCYNPNPQKLSDLLDDNVYSSFISNGKQTDSLAGKNQVLNMYQTRLFDITTDIVVKTLEINTIDETHASMLLDVEETKENYGGVEGKSRWTFLDESTFTFVKKEDGTVKIAEIVTNATKQQVPFPNS